MTLKWQIFSTWKWYKSFNNHKDTRKWKYIYKSTPFDHWLHKTFRHMYNFCQPNHSCGSYFVLSATLPQYEYSVFRSRSWICLGTLLGNAATHIRHRVLVHSVLHIPVRYPFTNISTSVERRGLCSIGKGYVLIIICWFVCLVRLPYIIGKRVNGFHKSCKIGRTWYKEQSGKLWGCSAQYHAYMIFFLLFFIRGIRVC